MGENCNKKLVLCFDALVYFGLSNHFFKEKMFECTQTGKQKFLMPPDFQMSFLSNH